MTLRLDILNFNTIKSNNDSLSLKIDHAGLFYINGSKIQINGLIKIINGINIDFFGDILLNGISLKQDSIVQRYLQRNSLFIGKISLIEDISVQENLKYFSRLWSGEDLSKAAAFGFGIADQILNTKVMNLSNNQKIFINFVKLLTCNCYIWWIKKDFISNLNEEQKRIIDNIFNIRVGQNGVIIMI